MPALDVETDLYTPPEPAPSPYLVPLAELAKPSTEMPEEAAQKLAEAAERRAMEEHPAVRLRVLERTCRELKAGMPFDVRRHTAAIRPWRSLHRLVMERPDIDRAELYATAAAWLARQIAGKSRQTDPTISLRPPARPAARRPAPPVQEHIVGDVI
jgi:hypothetical protein